MVNAPYNKLDLLEVMRDAFVCVDMNGKLLLCNDAYCSMLGYRREELFTKTYIQLTPPKWHVLEQDIVKNQILVRGFSDIYEKEYQRKDGSVFPVELLTTLRQDVDEKPAMMMAVVRDISSRKLVEQERESTIEFLRIVNASTGTKEMISAALVYFKEKSNCTAVGIRLSEEDDYPYYVARGFPTEFIQAENMLCSRDSDGEIICDNSGNPVLDCMCGNVISGRFDPEKPFFTALGSFWTNSTTELLATTGEDDRQSRTRNRCNGEGYESVALIPLFAGQQRLGLLQLNDQRKGAFTLEKISIWERMAGYIAIALTKFRSEEAVIKLNKCLDQRVQERTCRLETALKEQESFSYSVSHDLRAPLRHINSYSAIVLEDFGDLLPPEAHAFLDRSRAASQHMGKLIDDLLELSKIGRATLVKETLNLSDLAEKVCATLREEEPYRAVDFKISEGLRVKGDRSLLSQMMVNLLGNAWKYTATNPSARIELGKESISGEGIYYIKDNGVGFDMAFSDKLFGAFQRLHGSEFEGTGIGLATVKRIIERHGGRIWAESKPDQGAKFFFTLP